MFRIPLATGPVVGATIATAALLLGTACLLATALILVLHPTVAHAGGSTGPRPLGQLAAHDAGPARGMATAAAQPTDGLVAHYPFDGDADDVSGFDNHGTPSSTVMLTTDRFGQPDAAYWFDGQSSRITVPGSPSLDRADTAVTMAAWIAIDGWSMVGDDFGPVLMKSDQATNAFMYRLYTSPAGLGASIGNWNQTATAPTDLAFGRWYHVAAAWDGAAARLYVDGELRDTVPLDVAAPAQDGRPLIIGADTPGLLEVFHGKIDDLRIYDRALADAEIAALAADAPVGVQAPPALAGLAITGAAPNPFNPVTTIGYALDRAQPIRLQVYDPRGRLVATLADGPHAAGRHTAVWHGRDARGRFVPSGVYLARLQSAERSVVRKLLLAR